MYSTAQISSRYLEPLPGDALSRGRSISAAFAGLIRETTQVRDGYMYVPQTPGLGREIDWAQIEARTITTV